jgi:16S rRNA (guanine966-N2)-methyltransferase
MASSISSSTSSSRIRIIGGNLKGRKLTFKGNHKLRPTLDRVRETLFNWLSMNIASAHCLDLFAGSGALGFESLSRGAVHTTFIDNERTAIQSILFNASLFLLKNIQCHCLSAESFLQRPSKKYDLIFLDPPYHLGLIQKTLNQLSSVLKKETLIYIEMEASLSLSFLDEQWTIIKLSSTKHITYALISLKMNSL